MFQWVRWRERTVTISCKSLLIRIITSTRQDCLTGDRWTGTHVVVVLVRMHVKYNQLHTER